jgi:hypothetical protein
MADTGIREHGLWDQRPPAALGIGRYGLPNKSEREPIVGVDPRNSSKARKGLDDLLGHSFLAQAASVLGGIAVGSAAYAARLGAARAGGAADPAPRESQAPRGVGGAHARRDDGRRQPDRPP